MSIAILLMALAGLVLIYASVKDESPVDVIKRAFNREN